MPIARVILLNTAPAPAVRRPRRSGPSPCSGWPGWFFTGGIPVRGEHLSGGAGRLRQRLEEVPPRRAPRQPARSRSGAGPVRDCHAAARKRSATRSSGRCATCRSRSTGRGARHHRAERRRQVDDAEAADEDPEADPRIVRRAGRVGALIEVAAGFHPDLTGRENVYLQGAIMGMKRAGDRQTLRRDRRVRRRRASSSTRRSSATRPA